MRWSLWQAEKCEFCGDVDFFLQCINIFQVTMTEVGSVNRKTPVRAKGHRSGNGNVGVTTVMLSEDVQDDV